MSPGSWLPCLTTCPPSIPFSLFLEIVLMRDLGHGPRGVAFFLSIAFASRLDDNWDQLRPATRQRHRLVTFRSVHDVSHFMSVRDATSGKTSSGKGNKTIIAVIRLSHGSAISSHTYNFTPPHTISSNGSIVFDFSKQLNQLAFAKAVDFALVVSLNCRLKSITSNIDPALVNKKVGCVLQS
jgi:hypothetical protein